MKSGQENDSIPVMAGLEQVASLVPVTMGLISSNDQISTLVSDWRIIHRESFTTWITATPMSTELWIRKQILNQADRILFLIEKDGIPFGHIGLTNFDYEAKSCEIDNVIRGRNDVFQGGMTFVLKTLLDWCFNELKLGRVFLKVFADNLKALALYERCGFHVTKKVPL